MLSRRNGPLLELVLATRNEDKIREIREILAQLPIVLLSPPNVPDWQEPDESGATLDENALIKARAASAATGRAAVADDTGLEVDALGGEPGAHSSRYSGPDATYASNCDKLLDELSGVADRDARFRTVVATAGLDAATGRGEIVAEGILEGAIAIARRGHGGFGYDPVFVPSGGTRTLAEMTVDEKNAISHRGRAFRAFAHELSARLSAHA